MEFLVEKALMNRAISLWLRFPVLKVLVGGALLPWTAFSSLTKKVKAQTTLSPNKEIAKTGPTTRDNFRIPSADVKHNVKLRLLLQISKAKVNVVVTLFPWIQRYVPIYGGRAVLGIGLCLSQSSSFFAPYACVIWFGVKGVRFPCALITTLSVCTGMTCFSGVLHGWSPSCTDGRAPTEIMDYVCQSSEICK